MPKGGEVLHTRCRVRWMGAGGTGWGGENVNTVLELGRKKLTRDTSHRSFLPVA